jgi:hypothetical protein
MNTLSREIRTDEKAVGLVSNAVPISFNEMLNPVARSLNDGNCIEDNQVGDLGTRRKDLISNCLGQGKLATDTFSNQKHENAYTDTYDLEFGVSETQNVSFHTSVNLAADSLPVRLKLVPFNMESTLGK